MADFPGYVGLMAKADVVGWLPGKTTGLRYPPVSFVAALAPVSAHVHADAYTDDSTPTPPPMDGHVGVVRDETTTASTWFDKVHILPRAKIDFGNIVTQVDSRFELFNAFRRQTVSLLTVANNASPGVSLPDLPAPIATREPFTSFLDPTSTDLGPIAQIVRALRDGLSIFDDDIDFTFDLGGTVSLRVKGRRVVFLSVDFDGITQEHLEFRTDVIEKQTGVEQRIATRKVPRQILEVDLYLVELDRQRVQMLLFDWQHREFSVPVWSEQMRVTAAVVGGTTPTVSVDSTANVDLRVGGLAGVYKDARTFDVLLVTGATGTSVTFASNIVNSYAVGDLVVPVALCHAQSIVSGTRHPVNLETMRMRFRVVDNETSAPTGDVSTFSTYLGKVLLDDANFITGSAMAETFSRRISVVDNEVGIVVQSSPWDRNRRGHHKGFFTKTRAALYRIRRLLYALRGKQVSFYIPTFAQDLTVNSNLVSGLLTMRVENIGYARFGYGRHPKRDFKITFTDGTSLFRVVQSAVEVNATIEELTLDAAWPVGRTIAEIASIYFLEKVRIDTDNILIEHGTTVGQAKIFFPVKVVLD